jgi:hypothetical protein
MGYLNLSMKDGKRVARNAGYKTRFIADGTKGTDNRFAINYFRTTIVTYIEKPDGSKWLTVNTGGYDHARTTREKIADGLGMIGLSLFYGLKGDPMEGQLRVHAPCIENGTRAFTVRNNKLTLVWMPDGKGWMRSGE